MMRRTVTADPAAALDLLDRAHATVLQAATATAAADRYVQAHLGALRAAAALLAARPDGRQGAASGSGGRAVRGGRSRPGNVWQAVARVAPELGEWSAYLAWCADRRHAIETDGVPVGRREADDLLRSAQIFVGLIEAALGLPARRSDPVLVAFDRGGRESVVPRADLVPEPAVT